MVDEATANALNALLRKLGVLYREAPPRFYIVSGEVRREDGLPLHGVHMHAVNEGKRRFIRLSEDSTDAEGHYTIRYELLPGVDSINLETGWETSSDALGLGNSYVGGVLGTPPSASRIVSCAWSFVAP